jgi:uncharacterized protein YlxW (UPF0749 family)
MEQKHSPLTIVSLIVAGLSLIFALLAFGKIASVASQNDAIKRELIQLNESVRMAQAENARLASRLSGAARDLESLEVRYADLQVRLESVITCVRTGKCAGQMG